MSMQAASAGSSTTPLSRHECPGPLPDHKSRLHQRLSAMHTFTAREQLLFGNAKVNRAAVEDRVEQLRKHDEEDKKRLTSKEDLTKKQLARTEADTSDPSFEAAKIAQMNENGMDRENMARDCVDRKLKTSHLERQTRKSQLFEDPAMAAKTVTNDEVK